MLFEHRKGGQLVTSRAFDSFFYRRPPTARQAKWNMRQKLMHIKTASL